MGVTDMPKKLVSDELWSLVEPLLPEHKPTPKGGRPRISDRAALTGIIFVLKTGIPWEDLPQEMGCGSGMTLLAQTSGLAKSWCLGEPASYYPTKYALYKKDRLEQSQY